MNVINAGDTSPLLDEQLKAGLEGNFERGAAIAEELERRFPDSHRAAFNRAWYKMMQGNLLEGLSCLDRGRWIGAFGGPRLPTKSPIYHGESLTGKHLLMVSEGGLGDEIINVRFAKNFAERGARVIVSCDPTLKSVFSRVEGVSSVVGHRGAPEVFHDFWVPAMSAARVLETEYVSLSGLPYLRPSSEYQEKWRRLLSGKFKPGDVRIGLRFYGNPEFEHEQHRKFPKEQMLSAVGERRWISLQKEETDLPIESWEDTLAIVSLLDLVITSCTSVAHAAAALGKPTWIVLPVLPYYLWALPGATSPWYRSARLFRQQRFGTWDEPFAEIREALTNFSG